MSRAKLISVVFVAGISVFLAACGGKLHYPSYYVLNLPSPAPQPAQFKPSLGSVGVRSFSALRVIRAGAIVYRQSPKQLDLYNYDGWAVDPRSPITITFDHVLESRSVSQSVHSSGMSQAAEQAIANLVSSMQGRLLQLQESASKGIKDAPEK
jgi:uncharacterized lipoprotein YmbA